MFIIELSDDYGAAYYGPFADEAAAEKWVEKSLKEEKGFMESGFVYIRGNMRIGNLIELETTYKPGIIRDGH